MPALPFIMILLLVAGPPPTTRPPEGPPEVPPEDPPEKPLEIPWEGLQENQTGIAAFSDGLALWLLPPVMWMVLAAVLCRATLNHLGTDHQPARKAKSEADPKRAMAAHRRYRRALLIAMPVAFGVQLFTGGLDALRIDTALPRLLLELAALVPWALAGFLLVWLEAPIHERLHAALVLRRLDQGRPLPAFRARYAHAVRAARCLAVASAVPALLLLVVIRLSEAFAPADTAPLWLIAGVLLIQAVAPAAATWILPVKPLPADGPTRRMLSAVTAQAGLPRTKLLVWDTDQTLVNAAALNDPLTGGRVLLTDGLLNDAPDWPLRFVLAHELGHLAHRHHRLIALTAIATAASAYTLMQHGMPASYWADPLAWPVCVAVVGGFAWLMVTAVMRRIEQQADAFATRVIHQLGKPPETNESDLPASATLPGVLPGVILPGAVGKAQQAMRLLHTFSTGTDAAHGSLTSRLNALQALEGCPTDDLPIDRRMRYVRWAVYALLVFSALSLATG